MAVHDDHRKRMRERYEENGLDTFNNINVLELLLFYAIPRKDTNPVAHALMERFKTLNAVFDASVEELEQVEGVGHSTAVFLKLIPDVTKRYEIEKSLTRTAIRNTSDAGEYLIPRFLYSPEEHILLLTINSQNEIIDCHEVGRGVVNGAETNVRMIAEAALADKAAAVILSHNHPDGKPEPSREDLDMTRQIYRALSLIGIPLLDHIIVAGREYVSLADRGYISKCAANG